MATIERTDDLDLVVGRRWTPHILIVMLDHDRPMRFSELVDAVPGLSKRLLTARLNELELAGLVRRDVNAGKPVIITYTLTEGGLLRTGLQALRAWSQERSA